MQEEITYLENNGTWTLQYLPLGKCALGSQWVCHNKYDFNDLLDRRKSHLGVLGNHQQEGINYTETFAPVVKMITIRAFLLLLFLSIENFINWMFKMLSLIVI